MRNRTNTSLFLFVFLFAASILFQSKDVFAQQEDPNNPRTWKYFKILARAEDDSIYIIAQDDMGIDPKLESYTLVINVTDPNPQNQYVVLGDEADPSAQRYAWSQLSKRVQDGLINWQGTNKENLNQRKLDYASVFIDVIRQIKIKEFVAPPKRERAIRNTTAYINPYFTVFGWEPVGIPIKRSIGFTFGMGSKYAGPFESDEVAAGFSMLGVSVQYVTRIRELNTHDLGSDSVENKPWKQYNAIFMPPRGLKLTYTIPLGNFLEVGVYSEIKETGVVPGGGPPLYTFINQKDGTTMPNNLVTGTKMLAEFRYPFRMFGSTRTQFYVAYYMDETNIGLFTRESRLVGSVFDFRVNATLKKIRNFQLLVEIMVSNIAEGFALNSFAVGPSIRLSKLDTGKFGLLSAFVNFRFKLGDYFDEREKK
ncbi:MAG TPA: hypothetical protein VGK25_13505 [Ignavibacteria bacterium]